jgi:hypothetical protein
VFALSRDTGTQTDMPSLLCPSPVLRRAFRSVEEARPAVPTLLGYRLRRAARNEMLYGGVRVTQLVARPPDVVVTKSEELSLPSVERERGDMQISFKDVQLHMAPNNMYHGFKHDFAHIKNVDLKKRHLPAPKFHPPPAELRIAPATAEAWAARPRQWTPLQVIKPVGTQYSVAGRQSGLRHGGKSLRQERLNQKGLGWKRIMRSQWQNDVDSWTYHPKRGY